MDVDPGEHNCTVPGLTPHPPKNKQLRVPSWGVVSGELQIISVAGPQSTDHRPLFAEPVLSKMLILSYFSICLSIYILTIFFLLNISKKWLNSERDRPEVKHKM